MLKRTLCCKSVNYKICEKNIEVMAAILILMPIFSKPYDILRKQVFCKLLYDVKMVTLLRI